MRSTKPILVSLTLMALVLLIGCAFESQVQIPADEAYLPIADSHALAIVTDTLLTTPLRELGATVSVIVGDARTGAVLADHDADRYMLPASVQKLFVAADAMLTQPEDFRFTTRIFSNGLLIDGTVHGDLVMLGGWDPSLSGDRPYADWPWAVFDSLAHEIKAAGVDTITGDIIAQGDAYIPGGWEVGDLRYRFAPRISQLNWNDGSVSHAQAVTGRGAINLKVMVWPDPIFWSVQHGDLWPHGSAKVVKPTVPVKVISAPSPLEKPYQPAGSWDIKLTPSVMPRALAADAFRESLRRAGVQGGDSTLVVTPRPMPVPMPAADGVSLVHRSASLDSLLLPMLKVSSNAWAEQIAAGTGSFKWGNYYPTWPSVLDSLGLPPDDGMRAADACGMSRRNRMRAETVHGLLVAANGRWGERWLNLLPKANEEGSTLEGRFEGLEDRIIAKTGSLSGCRSLAGYILDQDGDPALDFVIFVNHAPSSPTATIDEYVAFLVTQLDRDLKE